MAVLSVLDAAKEAPNDIALIIGGRSYSWRELADRVPFDVIDAHAAGPMVVVPKLDLPSISLILGLIERQKPAVLLHPRLDEQERAAIVATLQPGLIDEQCLAVLHTSGTTGKPKGAMLSRDAFVAAADASATNLGWEDDDRWLLAMPLAHVGGLSILVRCLMARRCVVVPDVVDRFDPAQILDVIQRDRVSLASFVPTMLKRIFDLRRGPALPSHLRAILLGGAATPSSVLTLARELHTPVLTTYGLTEACSQVTTQRYGSGPSPDEGSGIPVRGTEVRIAVEDGRIEVRGPTLMMGYLGGPRIDASSWFRTEDFGRIDEKGRLHVLGRSQELIVTGGENVYPLEVERMLESLPGITSACVFGMPDETWGEIVCAAIVGDACSMNDLKMAPHKRPRRIAFLNELPMTAAGKLDRRATCSAAQPHLKPWLWR